MCVVGFAREAAPRTEIVMEVMSLPRRLATPRSYQFVGFNCPSVQSVRRPSIRFFSLTSLEEAGGFCE